MKEMVLAALQSHREVMDIVEKELASKIPEVVEILVTAYLAGNKLLVMGNGGSAADAQHMAAEMVGRFILERKGLPAIALTTDSSILTAVGNDYGFDRAFQRQIEALAAGGDVVVGISTSGSSENVLEALKLAREMGCRTIGLLGRDGGTIKDLVDVDLTVRSPETPRIQEAHITIIHILCCLVEQRLFGVGSQV
jgi:D-sedoheptulose 7-phosphate isomerase